MTYDVLNLVELCWKINATYPSKIQYAILIKKNYDPDKDIRNFLNSLTKGFGFLFFSLPFGLSHIVVIFCSIKNL